MREHSPTTFPDLWDAAGQIPDHPYAAARREWEAVLSPRVDLHLVERAESLGVDAGKFTGYLLATNGDIGLATAWAVEHRFWDEEAERMVPRFTTDDTSEWMRLGWRDVNRAAAFDMVGLGPADAVAWSGLIRDVGADPGRIEVGVDPDEAVAAIAAGWPRCPAWQAVRRPGDLADAIELGQLVLDA